jgi:cytoskeletal protein CcmA (bactofilin family)
VKRSEATIGKSVLIKGQLYSEEDLHLDGHIEGTLEIPNSRLTVGKSGKVHASIRAREVDVHGTVQGNIEAQEKITIRGAANLVGDLKSATISIEDGAYFKGSIDIVRTPPPKAAPPPMAQRAAAGQPVRNDQAVVKPDASGSKT